MIEEFIDLSKECIIRGYRLTELLERGTVTTLYRALTEELWLPPEVLIRLLHVPETLSEQTKTHFTSQFLHEAKRIVRLRHPSLAPLFGYGEQNGLLYLLMPAMQANTLAALLEQQHQWSPSEAFVLLAPISAALDYIHSHDLVYQFLHPGTIVLLKDAPPQITGLNLTQMLCQGGLAMHPDDMQQQYKHLRDSSGAYVSAPEYLAPEVIKGLAPDPRSDVYSLGVILFTLLSGHPPFTGNDYLEIVQKHIHEPLPSLHANRPELPVALEIMVNRALHRNPERRFQTPHEFITAFSHIVEGRLETPVTIQNASTVEQVQSLPFPAITIDSPLWSYRQTLALRSSEPLIPLSSKEDIANEAWLNSAQDRALEDNWLSETQTEMPEEEEEEIFAEEEKDEEPEEMSQAEAMLALLAQSENGSLTRRTSDLTRDSQIGYTAPYVRDTGPYRFNSTEVTSSSASLPLL